MAEGKSTLAVLGATGALGNALAGRWAMAGYPVIIGSRKADRAEASAAAMRAAKPGVDVRGMGNEAASGAADIVVLTVPFAHQTPTLEGLRKACSGKLFVDTTVPLMPPKVGTVQLPPEGCAAVIAQQILGESVRVCSAFHNVAADKLAADGDVGCDVLVFGNKLNDRNEVVTLVEATGLRGSHGGPLANSAAAEALTAVLIGINRRYKVPGSGIVITGDLQNPDA